MDLASLRKTKKINQTKANRRAIRIFIMTYLDFHPHHFLSADGIKGLYKEEWLLNPNPVDRRTIVFDSKVLMLLSDKTIEKLIEKIENIPYEAEYKNEILEELKRILKYRKLDIRKIQKQFRYPTPNEYGPIFRVWSTSQFIRLGDDIFEIGTKAEEE